MSRQVTVARQTAHALPRLESWDSATYRVLGAGRRGSGGTTASHFQQPREVAALFIENLEAFDAAVPVIESPATWQARISFNSRWLIGLAVVALALLVVTPVLASGVGAARSRGPVLSGYAGEQVGASTAAEPPVIDASTQASPPAAPPAQAQPAGSYNLVGAPSISVGQIESVLQQYGSPAVGLGQRLYDLGVQYGIDPAYALAFFVHESGCGTRGVARFTRSLGNIRWSDGYDNYEGYRSYGDWVSGFEDWYKLIKELYVGGWHLQTVDQIVPVYAPAADNNSPSSYAASVKYMVDSWRGK